MSSRTTQIKDENGVVALVDDLSQGIHVASITQQLMHAGRMFALSLVTKALTNGSSVEILLRTDLKPVHASLRMTATGTADLQVFEAPTTTADGTEQVNVARNRVIGGTSPVKLFSGPTTTADGLILVDEIVPPAGERVVMGLLSDEAVLKPSTDYLLKLSNTSGGNIDVGFVIDWFESDSKFFA